MARNKRLREVSKATQFTSENQPSPESKSKGQINLSIEKNIISTLRTEIKENTTILKDIPQALQAEVGQGKLDNAIKLLNIIKEPEEQKIINEIKSEDGLKINIQPVKTNE